MAKKNTFALEFNVDQNLYLLENYLYMLDSLEFDSEIKCILEQLKSIVNEKLYKDFSEEYDILDSKLKVEYLLKK